MNRTVLGIGEFLFVLFFNIVLLIEVIVRCYICESERSFSQLKLIKNARRSTTSESRLCGLALMKIIKD